MITALTDPALLLADAKEFATTVYFWLGVIVALAFVMGFTALWLRKKLMTPPSQPPMGFSLKDLRQMHAEGQLSDEELARAEGKALSRSRSHYLGLAAAPPQEAEDIGHLSTGDEEDIEGRPENIDDVSDKNSDL